MCLQPQATEMMVMMPAGMDLTEMRSPMMMMVMPVTTAMTTPVTPSMMTGNMMQPQMMSQPPTDNSNNDMKSMMMMTQMMQQMMAMQPTAAGGDETKKPETTPTPAVNGDINGNMMNMMNMMGNNGAMMANGNNMGGATMNPQTMDVPAGDSNQNMMDSLVKYGEANRYRREPAHMPQTPAHPVRAMQPRAHHRHHQSRP